MIEIISGTDRPSSRTLAVAGILREMYQKLGAPVDILDLSQLKLSDASGGNYFAGAQGSFAQAVHRVTEAEGLVIVVPEYNGSYPGILKLFIDYWRYPDSFEHRPVALVGLGTRWGGLRPVEHLQQVFGYRNAYIFPNRVFLTNVKEVLEDNIIKDAALVDLLQVQSRGFLSYVKALENQKLDANSIRRATKK